MWTPRKVGGWGESLVGGIPWPTRGGIPWPSTVTTEDTWALRRTVRQVCPSGEELGVRELCRRRLFQESLILPAKPEGPSPQEVCPRCTGFRLRTPSDQAGRLLFDDQRQRTSSESWPSRPDRNTSAVCRGRFRVSRVGNLPGDQHPPRCRVEIRHHGGIRVGPASGGSVVPQVGMLGNGRRVENDTLNHLAVGPMTQVG